MSKIKFEEDEDEEETDYSEMSLSELKAECKDRGLKVKKGMSKEDLIEMLEEDAEAAGARLVVEPVMANGSPDGDAETACAALGTALANA